MSRAEPSGFSAVVVRGCVFPTDRAYHVHHNVWVRTDAPDTFTIGATAFAVAQAGELVAFVPKPVGSRIDADGSVGVVELWKTMAPVRTPIAGTIVATNAKAAADPAMINHDPYHAGWLVTLQVDPALSATTLAAQRDALVTNEAIAAAFEAAMVLENFEPLPERRR